MPALDSPNFDPLRADPRFTEFLRRTGLALTEPIRTRRLQG